MDISIDALRQNARRVVDDARNQYISPYEEWTSDELRELLVQYKIPIRDSANASHETLVRICDTVFGAEVAETEKDSRTSYSIEDLVRMEAAARLIQKAYFRRKAIQRQKYHEEQIRQHYHNFNNKQAGGRDHAVDYDAEGGDCDNQNLGDWEEGEYYEEAFRRQSMLRRINERGDDYDEEIEVEWRKPSWKFAKRFERASRPHRSGKAMKKYDWTSVTLGRHCFSGGCGEQLDLWNEGRTSEFSQFGSGITNYFKVRRKHTQAVSLLLGSMDLIFMISFRLRPLN